MARWTPDRVARLGFLAGCGFTVASIMSDGLVAARSKRAVRTDASRWHVPIGGDGGLPVALSPPISAGSTPAARAHGTTSAELALTVLRIVVRDNLSEAVIDDGDP